MLNALEMWLWRRMASITWEMKRTKYMYSVLREIGVVRELLRTLTNRKKKWLGHIMRGKSLYRTVIEGTLEGRRGRRRTTLLGHLAGGGGGGGGWGGGGRSYGELKRMANIMAEDRRMEAVKPCKRTCQR